MKRVSIVATKDEKGGECPPDFTATFFAVVNKCAKRVSGLRPDIAQVNGFLAGI